MMQSEFFGEVREGRINVEDVCRISGNHPHEPAREQIVFEIGENHATTMIIPLELEEGSTLVAERRYIPGGVEHPGTKVLGSAPYHDLLYRNRRRDRR